MIGGGMYAQYRLLKDRLLKATDCQPHQQGRSSSSHLPL
jgi:hypothetical protein